MTNPKHLEQVPENRQAIAPYNFVELPDEVVKAEEQLPNNCYHSNRHTGRIKCTLTTESPLYTRCGWTPTDFAKFSEMSFQDRPEDLKIQRAAFFTNPANQRPTIPGSSLRGMLRTLVEIVSFSKIERVSDQQRFFFRAVAADKEDPLTEEYRRYMGNQGANVRAGYLVQEGDSWSIRPAKIVDGVSFVWVKEQDILLEFSPGEPELIPLDNLSQYRPQYIVNISCGKINTIRNRKFARKVSRNCSSYEHRGVLVTSGNMLEGTPSGTRPKRINHCIIFEPNPSAAPRKIDDDAIKSYRNALTDFQKHNPPFDPDMGVLKRGRSIFYCEPESDQPVTLFGQSPNFRIPYSPQGNGQAASAVDFIPENLRNPETIDLADAIFGFVRGEKQKDGQRQACAGRIFISDAVCEKTSADEIWLSKGTIIPQILTSPKPSTFQHYLVQTNAEKKQLKHYGSQPGKTVIRGHKLYWHKGSSLSIEHENPNDVSESQKTQIKPIKAGVAFTFTINFENLSDVELGALLWVLNIANDENYRLSLGMGKPLGMGAIRIAHDLYLSDRQERYNKLFDGNNWATGELSNSDEDNNSYVNCFKDYVLKNLSKTGKWEDIPRIKMLLAMLKWPGLSLDKTRYMEIEPDINKNPLDAPNSGDKTVTEYTSRRVLPSPIQVFPKQKFDVGQIVDANVTNKIDNGKKITYQIAENIKLQVSEYKKYEYLTVGQAVKVEILEVKDGKVKKVKLVD